MKVNQVIEQIENLMKDISQSSLLCDAEMTVANLNTRDGEQEMNPSDEFGMRCYIERLENEKRWEQIQGER